MRAPSARPFRTPACTLRPPRPRLRAAVLALLLGQAGLIAPFDPASAAPLPAPVHDADGAELRRISLRELGQMRPIDFHGLDHSVEIPLPVRLDEAILRARLHLAYTFSPALLPGLSQIRVLVNDEVVATVVAQAGKLGTPQQIELPFDPSVLTEYAKLRLQFVGHYAESCEQPFHSSLWAQVSADSRIEFTRRRLPLADDLGLLPAPFFDPRDSQRLVLPFVIAGPRTAEMVGAAAVLASWFGAQAGFRGAAFPVLDRLPAEGHAIVLVAGTQAPAGLALAPVQAPTLRLQAHPQDAAGKLLVLQGADLAQLRSAAEALSLGRAALSGATATVTGYQTPPPLPADSGPRALPRHGVVKLGELVAQPQQLQARGAFLPELRLPLPLPADAWAWPSKGVPVDLRLRYTPPPEGASARLAVHLNEQLVTAFALRSGEAGAPARNALLPFLDTGGLEERRRFTLPAHLLGGGNTLSLRVEIPPTEGSGCQQQARVSQVSIDPDSQLDFSGLARRAELPELALFANRAYPYARQPDLARTALLLPEAPRPAEVEVALLAAGRLGAASGLPGVRLLVAHPATLKTPAMQQELAGRDLLVIARGDGAGLPEEWRARLPLRLNERERELPGLPPPLERAAATPAQPAPEGDSAAARLKLSSAGPLALLQAFESPLQAGRSVVLLQASEDAAWPRLHAALLDEARIARLHGDLTLLHAERIDAYRVGPHYTVSDLDLLDRLLLRLREAPGLLLLLGGGAALLLGAAVLAGLRQRARRRLAGEV